MLNAFTTERNANYATSGDDNECYGGNQFTICVCIKAITLYALNLPNDMCQLYLGKAGKMPTQYFPHFPIKSCALFPHLLNLEWTCDFGQSDAVAVLELNFKRLCNLSLYLLHTCHCRMKKPGPGY